MLKVIFYLKAGKVSKKGESPIFARISYQQQSITMSTGKKILKERWQFTKNLRTVVKLEKEKVLKHSLELFLLNIEKKFNELAKESSDISLVQLKNEFNGKTIIQTQGVSIVEIMQKHNAYFEKKVNAEERSKASFQKYERSKELLVNFMKQQY